MSNKDFANYVTSTAFSISLSKAMVGALDFQVRKEFDNNLPFMPYHISTYRSLERRGLVVWNVRPDGVKNGLRVTDAGRAMHTLLVLAELCEPLPRQDVA